MPDGPGTDPTATGREPGLLRDLGGRLGILAASALVAVVAYTLLGFVVPDLALRAVLATVVCGHSSRWHAAAHRGAPAGRRPRGAP